LIAEPPNNGYYYHGWRDPFVYQRANSKDDKEWIIITAAGMLNGELESVMGGILIYSSKNLTCPECWEFKGIMAGGTYPDFVMWEAPWMFDIDPSAKTEYTQVLGFAGDKWDWNNPKNPMDHTGYRPNFAWLGHLNTTTYKMTLSEYGPLLLDLGDAMYCPNQLHDDKGRNLLVGWLHECLNGENACPNKFTWKGAGSMSTPRKMTVIGEHIFQEPVEEMDDLRVNIIPNSDFNDIILDPLTIFTALKGQHYFLEFNVTFEQINSTGV